MHARDLVKTSEGKRQIGGGARRKTENKTKTNPTINWLRWCRLDLSCSG